MFTHTGCTSLIDIEQAVKLWSKSENTISVGILDFSFEADQKMEVLNVNEDVAQ